MTEKYPYEIWQQIEDYAQTRLIGFIQKQFRCAREDAEEAVQDALLTMWQAREKGLEAPRHPLSYAGRAAWNAYNIRQRPQARKKTVREADMADDDNNTSALLLARQPSASPEDEAIMQEKMEILFNRLSLFSLEKQETFYLYYIEGLSYSQISAQLGVGENTLKGRIHDIKEKFEEEGFLDLGLSV